jgi:hypothetical protein
MGASMTGLDYTWWHGMYDVAKVFYTQFIPEAKALDPKVVDDVIGNMPVIFPIQMKILNSPA